MQSMPSSPFLKASFNIILFCTRRPSRLSLSLRFPPPKYKVRSTYHESFHYRVYCIFLFLHPSLAQMSSSTPYCQTRMFLPQCKDQVSHPYKTTGKILVNMYYQSLYFCIANWNTNYFARHVSKLSMISISLLLIASYMQFWLVRFAACEDT